MDQLRSLVEGVDLQPTAVLDILLTALLFYGLFSLIQGTRAVRLVIGAIVLYGVYAVARLLDLRMLSGILETGAVVGLLALVVIFQPELRRGLERIGRVGSMGWAFAPTGAAGLAEKVARTVSRTAAKLAGQRIGALIVIERDTGLEDTAETGVMLHADLSEELLDSIFMPRGALHDGAVIIHGDKVLAAGAVLPLSEIAVHQQRYGTRHRAAIGMTEQTDALVVVVSEETGSMSLVERGRVIRDLDEERLRTSLAAMLRPTASAQRAAAGISALGTPLRGKRPRGLRSRRGNLSATAPAAAPSTTSSGTPSASGAGAASTGAAETPAAPAAEGSETAAASQAGPQA
jgi:diadenylate cyclase